MSSDPASPSTADQREAALELLIAGRSGPTFVLDPAIDNVLGRAAEALVVLPDRLASRVHAALRFDPAANEWTLRDLGSRNGTWLGGTRVTTATLTDGAVLRVGTSELVFHLAAPTDTPPDAPEGMPSAARGDQRGIAGGIRLADVVLGLDEPPQRIFASGRP